MTVPDSIGESAVCSTSNKIKLECLPSRSAEFSPGTSFRFNAPLVCASVTVLVTGIRRQPKPACRGPARTSPRRETPVASFFSTLGWGRQQPAAYELGTPCCVRACRRIQPASFFGSCYSIDRETLPADDFSPDTLKGDSTHVTVSELLESAAVGAVASSLVLLVLRFPETGRFSFHVSFFFSYFHSLPLSVPRFRPVAMCLHKRDPPRLLIIGMC